MQDWWPQQPQAGRDSDEYAQVPPCHGADPPSRAPKRIPQLPRNAQTRPTHRKRQKCLKINPYPSKSNCLTRKRNWKNWKKSSFKLEITGKTGRAKLEVWEGPSTARGHVHNNTEHAMSHDRRAS